MTQDKWLNWLVWGGEMPSFIEGIEEVPPPINFEDTSMEHDEARDQADYEENIRND